MINEILNKWIADSVAYNFEKEYGVNNTIRADFINRQDDFYITLINKFLDIIKEPKSISNSKHDLLAIAHGLAIYSKANTKDAFYGVESNRNMLYVCAALYLCDYHAIASLFCQQIDRKYIHENYQAIALYILSGGDSRNIKVDSSIINYIETGQQELIYNVLRSLNYSIERNNFRDADTFFDCYVCRAVLYKFDEHNIWKDLNKQATDINWKKYIALSARQHILSFLPSQLEAIDKGLLSFDKSFSLKMPTSAGKSYLTQLVIFEELQKNPNAHILYLAPLRSLSFELTKKYRRIASILSFTMDSAYGGLDNVDINKIRNKNLLITTPETLMALEGSLNDFLISYSLIICDEGQLLDSFTRGISYELLLTRLKKMNNKRFLFISAIIPNINEVNEWLGGEKEAVAESNYRPCKIRLGIGSVNKGGINVQLYNDSYNNAISVINSFVNNVELEGYSLDQAMKCSCVLALQSLRAGSVILYTQTKGGNNGASAFGKKMIEVIDKTRLPKPNDFYISLDKLNQIHQYVSYQIGSDHILSKCIEKGFAYHNGSLPQDFRELIENAFDSGVFRLLIATSTLSEGVNMPVKTIVLGNILEFGEDNKMHVIDRMRLKNITGRTGRAGREDSGTVLIMNNKPYIIDEVKEALTGESDRKIRGTLYDIVKYLDKFGKQLTDEQISDALEKSQLAWAIDFMIERNTSNYSVDDIDIADIVNDTLAHFLGDNNVKQMLERVFNLRLEAIKKGTSKNYRYFHDSGMDLDLFESTESYFESHDIDNLRKPDIEDLNWFRSFIYILIECGSIKLPVKSPRKERLVEMLWLWIHGHQYQEIAKSLKLDTNVIISTISDYTRGLPISRIKSVVRYLNSKYGIKTDEYERLFRYLKYGVDSDLKISLKHQFPNMDRISLNFIIDNLTNSEILKKVFVNGRFKLAELRKNILPILNDAHLPKLCKGRILRIFISKT